MNVKDILCDAETAPTKTSLELHRAAVLVLRQKGYTWREIATFLTDRGVPATHTTVLRLTTNTQKKGKPRMTTSSLPKATDYQNALESIEITLAQRIMLKAHFDATNRSITYSQLAKAAGYESYDGANAQYGALGRRLGEAVGFDFVESDTRPGEKFYSSSIGFPNPYAEGHFQLVMHHELAKSLESLGPIWFRDVDIYQLGEKFAADNISDKRAQSVLAWIEKTTWDDEVRLDSDYVAALATAIGCLADEFPKFSNNAEVLGFTDGLTGNLSSR